MRIFTQLAAAAGKKAKDMVWRVLNVAEKNDASKRIANLLSNGRAVAKNGVSVYNRIYEFNFTWPTNQNQVQMAFTSVSGHVLDYEFTPQFRKWNSCSPAELFDAPVEKYCPNDSIKVKENLEKEARYAQVLVIWTDGDREGENIGYEIIEICKRVNPRLTVRRAKFSEITPTAITRAINNLGEPNPRINDAVEVRRILDLRIGAAFTRLQSLRLQKKFPFLETVSYGSCQFPTLGFVVERYKAIQNFVVEDFWRLRVTHLVENCAVEFNWARIRLFNQLACQTLHEKCLENPTAKVTKVESKQKSKWRPVALDTVEFEKLACRKLKMSAKEAMKAAERLYTQGIISYPRTETNIFPQGLHLAPLIEQQGQGEAPWSDFARRLAQNAPNPRNGKKSDQAHPPIHPTRFEPNLGGNERKVYELIVRHFLACCSKDAIGQETTVEIEVANEKFVTHGLNILERNYLEVYPYDKWSDKELPRYTQGQMFQPQKIEMLEGQTTAPELLTEADLIALMEKHGIGTDATHADHIERVQYRKYIGKTPDGRFMPGLLGMGLVEGYDAMGFQMSKPYLRAALEVDLQKIIDGIKPADATLRDQVTAYQDVFAEVCRQLALLDESVGKYVGNLNPGPGGQNPPPQNGFNNNYNNGYTANNRGNNNNYGNPRAGNGSNRARGGNRGGAGAGRGRGRGGRRGRGRGRGRGDGGNSD